MRFLYCDVIVVFFIARFGETGRDGNENVGWHEICSFFHEFEKGKS